MCPKPIRRRLPKHQKTKRQSQVSFSATTLESLEAEQRDYYVRDSKTQGLNVKVTPAGRKVFLLRYNMPGRRGRKLTLGVFPRMTVPQARKLAMEAWAEIANGVDPAQLKADLANAATVEVFARRYLKEQVEIHTSAQTARDYESMLRNHVLPQIGSMRLDEVQRVDIERIHRSMRATPTRANRTLAVVKAMFNKAGDWGVLPYGNNPAVRIKLYNEEKRTRYFDGEEQEKIGQAIRELRAENPMSQSAYDAIVFLFRTGCRTKEALNLRWDDIDLERGEARLRESKTGAGKLFLGSSAVQLLQSIASTSQSEWVFPGRSLDRPLERLKKPWQKICQHASLKDAHLHDIRHTVGTYLAARGRTSSATAVLRHTNSSTTDRYVHPHIETIRIDPDAAISELTKRGI